MLLINRTENRNSTNIVMLDFEVARMCKWDIEKMRRIEKSISHLTREEKDLYLRSIDIANELAVGEVNKKKLLDFSDLVQFYNKYNKQIFAITMICLVVISEAMISFAMPSVPCFMHGTTIATVASNSSVAMGNVPVISMNKVTELTVTLIKNLITAGILATVASCVFDMFKSILEGNISKLPKTLINHSMMIACVLISPTVFNFISSCFNMGNVINFASKFSSMIM